MCRICFVHVSYMSRTYKGWKYVRQTMEISLLQVRNISETDTVQVRSWYGTKGNKERRGVKPVAGCRLLLNCYWKSAKQFNQSTAI